MLQLHEQQLVTINFHQPNVFFFTFGNSVGNFERCKQWFWCNSYNFWKCLFFFIKLS